MDLLFSSPLGDCNATFIESTTAGNIVFCSPKSLRELEIIHGSYGSQLASSIECDRVCVSKIHDKSIIVGINSADGMTHIWDGKTKALKAIFQAKLPKDTFISCIDGSKTYSTAFVVIAGLSSTTSLPTPSTIPSVLTIRIASEFLLPESDTSTTIAVGVVKLDCGLSLNRTSLMTHNNNNKTQIFKQRGNVTAIACHPSAHIACINSSFSSGSLSSLCVLFDLSALVDPASVAAKTDRGRRSSMSSKDDDVSPVGQLLVGTMLLRPLICLRIRHEGDKTSQCLQFEFHPHLDLFQGIVSIFSSSSELVETGVQVWSIHPGELKERFKSAKLDMDDDDDDNAAVVKSDGSFYPPLSFICHPFSSLEMSQDDDNNKSSRSLQTKSSGSKSKAMESSGPRSSSSSSSTTNRKKSVALNAVVAEIFPCACSLSLAAIFKPPNPTVALSKVTISSSFSSVTNRIIVCMSEPASQACHAILSQTQVAGLSLFDIHLRPVFVSSFLLGGTGSIDSAFTIKCSSSYNRLILSSTDTSKSKRLVHVFQISDFASCGHAQVLPVVSLASQLNQDCFLSSSSSSSARQETVAFDGALPFTLPSCYAIRSSVSTIQLKKLFATNRQSICLKPLRIFENHLFKTSLGASSIRKLKPQLIASLPTTLSRSSPELVTCDASLKVDVEGVLLPIKIVPSANEKALFVMFTLIHPSEGSSSSCYQAKTASIDKSPSFYSPQPQEQAKPAAADVKNKSIMSRLFKGSASKAEATPRESSNVNDENRFKLSKKSCVLSTMAVSMLLVLDSTGRLSQTNSAKQTSLASKLAPFSCISPLSSVCDFVCLNSNDGKMYMIDGTSGDVSAHLGVNHSGLCSPDCKIEVVGIWGEMKLDLPTNAGMYLLVSVVCEKIPTAASSIETPVKRTDGKAVVVDANRPSDAQFDVQKSKQKLEDTFDLLSSDSNFDTQSKNSAVIMSAGVQDDMFDLLELPLFSQKDSNQAKKLIKETVIIASPISAGESVLVLIKCSSLQASESSGISNIRMETGPRQAFDIFAGTSLITPQISSMESKNTTSRSSVASVSKECRYLQLDGGNLCKLLDNERIIEAVHQNTSTCARCVIGGIPMVQAPFSVRPTGASEHAVKMFARAEASNVIAASIVPELPVEKQSQFGDLLGLSWSSQKPTTTSNSVAGVVQEAFVDKASTSLLAIRSQWRVIVFDNRMNVRGEITWKSSEFHRRFNRSNACKIPSFPLSMIWVGACLIVSCDDGSVWSVILSPQVSSSFTPQTHCRQLFGCSSDSVGLNGFRLVCALPDRIAYATRSLSSGDICIRYRPFFPFEPLVTSFLNPRSNLALADSDLLVVNYLVEAFACASNKKKIEASMIAGGDQSEAQAKLLDPQVGRSLAAIRALSCFRLNQLATVVYKLEKAFNERILLPFPATCWIPGDAKFRLAHGCGERELSMLELFQCDMGLQEFVIDCDSLAGGGLPNPRGALAMGIRRLSNDLLDSRVVSDIAIAGRLSDFAGDDKTLNFVLFSHCIQALIAGIRQPLKLNQSVQLILTRIQELRKLFAKQINSRLFSNCMLTARCALALVMLCALSGSSLMTDITRAKSDLIRDLQINNLEAVSGSNQKEARLISRRPALLSVDDQISDDGFVVSNSREILNAAMIEADASSAERILSQWLQDQARVNHVSPKQSHLKQADLKSRQFVALSHFTHRLAFDKIEDWIGGSCYPECIEFVDEQRVQGLASLKTAEAASDDSKLASTTNSRTSSDSWVVGIGKGKKDIENVIGYWRFGDIVLGDKEEPLVIDSEGQRIEALSKFIDLSKYKNDLAFVATLGTDRAQISVSTSPVDPGRDPTKVKVTHDVILGNVDSGLATEGSDVTSGIVASFQRGSPLDVGVYHATENSSRCCMTFEFWVRLVSRSGLESVRMTGSDFLDKPIVAVERRFCRTGIPCSTFGDVVSWRLVLRKNGSLAFFFFDIHNPLKPCGLVQQGSDSGPFLAFDQWSHVAVTLDGTEQADNGVIAVALYHNGSCVGRGSSVVSMVDSNNGSLNHSRLILFPNLASLNSVVRFTEVRIWSIIRKDELIHDEKENYLSLAENKAQKKSRSVSMFGAANTVMAVNRLTSSLPAKTATEPQPVSVPVLASVQPFAPETVEPTNDSAADKRKKFRNASIAVKPGSSGVLLEPAAALKLPPSGSSSARSKTIAASLFPMTQPSDQPPPVLLSSGNLDSMSASSSTFATIRRATTSVALSSSLLPYVKELGSISKSLEIPSVDVFFDSRRLFLQDSKHNVVTHKGQPNEPSLFIWTIELDQASHGYSIGHSKYKINADSVLMLPSNFSLTFSNRRIIAMFASSFPQSSLQIFDVDRKRKVVDLVLPMDLIFWKWGFDSANFVGSLHLVMEGFILQWKTIFEGVNEESGAKELGYIAEGHQTRPVKLFNRSNTTSHPIILDYQSMQDQTLLVSVVLGASDRARKCIGMHMNGQTITSLSDTCATIHWRELHVPTERHCTVSQVDAVRLCNTSSGTVVLLGHVVQFGTDDSLDMTVIISCLRFQGLLEDSVTFAGQSDIPGSAIVWKQSYTFSIGPPATPLESNQDTAKFPAVTILHKDNDANFYILSASGQLCNANLTNGSKSSEEMKQIASRRPIQACFLTDLSLIQFMCQGSDELFSFLL